MKFYIYTSATFLLGTILCTPAALHCAQKTATITNATQFLLAYYIGEDIGIMGPGDSISKIVYYERYGCGAAGKGCKYSPRCDLLVDIKGKKDSATGKFMEISFPSIDKSGGIKDAYFQFKLEWFQPGFDDELNLFIMSPPNNPSLRMGRFIQ